MGEKSVTCVWRGELDNTSCLWQERVSLLLVWFKRQTKSKANCNSSVLNTLEWPSFENLIATLYPQFLEVVQYVLHRYPDCDIEDLEGEVNLLLILPTHLALKVVRFNCSRGLTLQHVPGLMRKGIPPQKVTHYIYSVHHSHNLSCLNPIIT